MSDGDIIGQPINAREQAIIAAAASLTYDKRLDRIGSTAQLVLSSLVVVGTVLTGFGLFADPANRLRASPELYIGPLVLAIAAALLALAALLPWGGSPNPANITKVESHFKVQVLVRGTLAAGAMLALAAAVAWAGWTTVFATSETGLTPTLVASRTVTAADTGETEGLSITAKLSGAPEGSIATVRAVEADGTRTLSTQLVGTAGTVDMAVAIADLAASEIQFELTDGGATLVSDSLSIEE